MSLAFRASDGLFHANFAAASPGGGYAQGADKDPVKALENAFSASPIPRLRPKPRRGSESVTATVTEDRGEPGELSSGADA